jgi:nucleoside-diphosphate-sugar epimerase
MADILVTGAGSLLGYPLVLRLADAGHTVTGLYRTRGALVAGLAQRGDVRLRQVDLSERDGLARADIGDCDTVVHIAGLSPRPNVTVADLVRDNVAATLHLAQWALGRGVRRFVFTSSMRVYGKVGGGVVRADTPSFDPCPYGACKLLCEHMLADVANRMPSISIRLPAVLSRGARLHWPAHVMEQAKSNNDIVIFNPGVPFNNAIHVSDFVAFTESLAIRNLSGFAALAVGAKDSMPIGDVVRRIIAGLGSTSRIRVTDSASQSFTVDSSVAVAGFGYVAPPIDLILEKFISENREATSSAGGSTGQR